MEKKYSERRPNPRPGKMHRIPLEEMKKQKPDVGTKMYSVHEHLYYIEEKTAPIFEYCVCEGEVTGFFHGGFTEICLRGYSPEGFPTPYRYKLSDVGTKIFYTAKEAAELARKMTDTYERTWGWL